MVIALVAILAISIFELIVWMRLFWRSRRLIVIPTAILLAAASVWLLIAWPTGWSFIVLLISCYRLFNLLRVVKGRMHEQYLKRTTGRTARVLVGLQVLTIALWAASNNFNLSAQFWLDLLVAFVAFATGTLVICTTRHIKSFAQEPALPLLADNELPSLTVAIPARNETESLEACLMSIIGSDYPKLEILVLDDCSSEPQTPEIIRRFAHDGVRFVQGDEPGPTWLAKNHAYQRLYDQASGDLILFCGVDTRFQARSLRLIVSCLISKRIKMLSILPKNILSDDKESLFALFVQPMRYAWELSLPRRLFNRPPVLSTCWLSYRREINSAGTFAAVSRKVVPESYFARHAMNAGGYSFLAADEPGIGLRSEKTLQEQRDTAVRTRYPQTHRRPELVLLLSAVELSLILLPLIAIALFVAGGGMLWACLVGILNLATLFYLYGQIVSLAYRQNRLTGYLVGPLAIIYDVWLLNYSMWKYEFSEVLWKQRNVCIPVMHVYSHLPKV